MKTYNHIYVLEDKVMKNNITEVVFILDRSGSMGGLESDTIGGFNSTLKKQKELDGKCLITTVLFDDQYEIIHDRVDAREAKEITEKEYFVRGCTALVDAIGKSITHIEKIHKYSRPEDIPEHTMFIITTDGMENASREYSADKVRKMIEQKKETGWEFLFIGANIDAVETARNYGIDADKSVDYVNDSPGVLNVHSSISKAVCCMRTMGSVGREWSEEISEDFNKRSGKKTRKSKK